jgi:hypothetical protein
VALEFCSRSQFRRKYTKGREKNMTIPNTDVTGGQGGTKERLGVGEWQAAV